MAARSWRIEEASQRLDELIEAAKDGEQTITRDGKEVAVVRSATAAPKQGAVPSFTEWLLAMPQAPEGEKEDLFAREPVRVRD